MMARNCHKSVYHAALLGGLRTVYVYPEEEEAFSFCGGLTVQQIERAWNHFSKTHPKETIDAFVLTSPTYEGVLSDVAQIAEFLHKKGIPLIVDEAHGAHLGLAHGIPKNSCKAGADLVIHSLHKTLPAMTQTALLHVNGGLVNRERLRRFLRIYQTSSPSYVLMASIDRAVSMMSENGENYFQVFLRRRQELMDTLQDCKRLRIYQKDGADPCKLVISTGKSGITGKMLYDRLRLQYDLQLEMAVGDYVVAILTVMDTEEGFGRLAQALLEIDAWIETLGPGERTDSVSRLPRGEAADRVCGLSGEAADRACGLSGEAADRACGLSGEAVDRVCGLSGEAIDRACGLAGEEADCVCGLAGEATDRIFRLPGAEAICTIEEASREETHIWMPYDQTEGRISGGFVFVYPPGIPFLAPGERISQEHIQGIRQSLEQGLSLKGLCGQDLPVLDRD